MNSSIVGGAAMLGKEEDGLLMPMLWEAANYLDILKRGHNLEKVEKHWSTLISEFGAICLPSLYHLSNYDRGF